MARNITILFCAVLMAAAGLSAQFFGFIDLDDAWLLDVANRVVSDGQELNRQVIETNPPLIVYMNMLPVVAANYLHISMINCFIAFVGLLGAISLGLAYIKIKDKLLWLYMVFGIFVMPAIVFGEREHLMVIFILPYFVSRWDEQKPNIAYSIIAGLMAGIGFSIKPFFVLIWITIVATRFFNNKKISEVFSLENFIIGSVGLGYLYFLFFIQPNYVNLVLPVLLKYYGIFGTNTRETIKDTIGLIFAYQAATVIVYIKAREHFTPQIRLCAAACIGGVILLTIQNKSWLNYYYPPFFFSLLSCQLIITNLVSDMKEVWRKAAVIISSLLIIIFVLSATKSNYSVVANVHNPGSARLLKILNKYADDKPVYALSFDLGAIYPEVIYSKAHNESHYGHLWMLPGIYANHKKTGNQMIFNAPNERPADEQKIIKDVVSEMVESPPEIVSVSTPNKVYANAGIDYKFDFIKYFSAEPEFKSLWQEYGYIGTFNDQDIYRHMVEPIDK